MTVEELFGSGAKVIELGGGARPAFRPNCDCRMCYDEHGRQTVDFTADFNELLPIQDSEWDGVYCCFVLEHLSYRKVRQFLTEVFRILSPGGKAVFITANTEAQIEWARSHREGWDNKDTFDSFSCILFGDQDYPENSHKNYLDMPLVGDLLQRAGFVDLIVQPFGARNTDMLAIATKPKVEQEDLFPVMVAKVPEPQLPTQHQPLSREEMFDKEYFNGGSKVGGYKDFYWDFPIHEVTARHVLDRKPESVMELGCARGFVLKRIQDRGIRANGLEISNHCWQLRVCNGIIQKDICETPWPWKDKEFDLCLSVAVLEHIPEKYLPAVFAEMERTCRRGLHGIDFGHNDDGFDRTHVSLHSQSWWKERLPNGHEAVDKENLERGEFPQLLLTDPQRKVKLNLGCHRVMFHHGWVNIDVLDVSQHAGAYGYHFLHHDVIKGIPFNTGAVSLIYTSHMLEHLGFDEGLALLRDCRRVLSPDGCMRVIVPDAGALLSMYREGDSSPYEMFHQINGECERVKTPIRKLWSLLMDNHRSVYDYQELATQLALAGFDAKKLSLHQSCGHYGMSQIVEETYDMFPSLSLIVGAYPKGR